MGTVLIFRIENSEGLGPYFTYHGSLWAKTNKPKRRFHVFGCPTRNALNDWLNDFVQEQSDFFEKEFMISVYRISVNKVIRDPRNHGSHHHYAEVLFNKHDATLVARIPPDQTLVSILQRDK